MANVKYLSRQTEQKLFGSHLLMQGHEKGYQHFKCTHFTSIEKQVLTTYINLSQFCLLETTPVLALNVLAKD